ncbi:MAG: carbohydrate ABC transporter permease [Micromonosporaceae bacterium]
MRRSKASVAGEVGFAALAVVFAFPLYLLVAMSLKTPQQAARSPFSAPTTPRLANYTEAWSQASLGVALLNSVVVTAVSVCLLVLLGALASYVLARRLSRLSNAVYLLFLVGIMVPFQMAIIPLYALIQDLGLMGTWTSVTVFYTGLLMPFTVFLYTGFLRAVPRDYEEAALTDGASPRQAFFRVVFPLLRPVTGTVAILDSLYVWNDFFAPLLFLGGSGQETLPVAIYAFVGQYVSQWNLIFAGLVIAMLPVLVIYFLLQRHMIKGFASGIRG